MDHKKRQSELNKQDGQSLGMYEEEGEPHEDRYLCRICSCFVKDRNWNRNLKCCGDCVNEVTKYGTF